jgi:nucleoporin NDC1
MHPRKDVWESNIRRCSGNSQGGNSKEAYSPTWGYLLHHIVGMFQLCAWCARTVASLTATSHLEDRYGVAQLSGCNKATLSSLLSCLLVVEVYLGRRSSARGVGFVGPNSIKWTVPSQGPVDVSRRKGSPFGKGSAMHKKAYALADILRTSVYQIIAAFGEEMVVGSGSGKGVAIAERDWLSQTTPLYGTHEMHLQKLGLFLEYRVN